MTVHQRRQWFLWPSSFGFCRRRYILVELPGLGTRNLNYLPVSATAVDGQVRLGDKRHAAYQALAICCKAGQKLFAVMHD